MSDQSSVNPGPELKNLCAVVDLCVSLYKFSNIELHSQGWYAVRVRVVPDAASFTCVPHTVIHISGESGPKMDPKQAWVIDEALCSFRSQIFRIKYCFEEVKLGETVLFRLFADLQALRSLAVSLEFELLWQEADLANLSAVPSDFSLKCVARDVVRIEDLCAGVHSYHGTTFDDEHFALCSMGLFSQVAGFTTMDVLEGLARRVASSSWLCNFVGEGRRYLANVETPRTHALNLNASLVRVSTKREAEVRFDNQELRKEVVRQLHAAVEAPVRSASGQSRPVTDAERRERIAAVYELLIGSHLRSRQGLVGFLRQAPPECFAPQTFDVLRKLIITAGSGPATPSALTREVLAARTDSPRAAGGLSTIAAGSPRAAGGLSTIAAGSPRALLATSLSISQLARRSQNHLERLGGAAANGSPTANGHHSAPQHQNQQQQPGSASAADASQQQQLVAIIPTVSEFMAEVAAQKLAPAAALQRLDELVVILSGESAGDWGVLCWVLRITPRELMRHVKVAWEAGQPARVVPFVVADSTVGNREAVAARATAHRQLLKQGHFAPPPVFQASVWLQPSEQPVLVVDDALGKGWLSEAGNHFGSGFRPKDEMHVVVFVHGFQGASTDLCLVKAHLMLMYPYLECFSSKTNEGNTHDSLQDMGKRLAQELAEYLTPLLSTTTRRPLKRISFVGHSIGNLILRSALTQREMEPFKPLLWMYISVSGPHLGFLYGSNAVVDTGLSFLKTIGRGKCLHQLTFSDAPRLHDCYLYQLAQQCPLSAFKLSILVSSPQDRYVPYHSSSLGACPAAAAAERDSRRGQLYNEMLQRLLAGVGQGGRAHLFRVGVDFDLRQKGFSFSKLVGRTAHIEFIESEQYVGILMWAVVHKYNMLAPQAHGWV